MSSTQSTDLSWIRCRPWEWSEGPPSPTGGGAALFLSAWKDGLIRTVPHVRSWEWFTIIVQAPYVVALLTHHGNFVEVDGETLQHGRPAPGGTAISDAALFEVRKCSTDAGAVVLCSVSTRGLLASVDGSGVRCIVDPAALLNTNWIDANGFLLEVARGEHVAPLLLPSLPTPPVVARPSTARATVRPP